MIQSYYRDKICYKCNTILSPQKWSAFQNQWILSRTKTAAQCFKKISTYAKLTVNFQLTCSGLKDIFHCFWDILAILTHTQNQKSNTTKINSRALTADDCVVIVHPRFCLVLSLFLPWPKKSLILKPNCFLFFFLSSVRTSTSITWRSQIGRIGSKWFGLEMKCESEIVIKLNLSDSQPFSHLE